ncbi:GIY-YIG nuclease family protein [Siccirubricoccus phaeus]|uniref:GIY-YIG nuclease family protein n=1 Tax=Siccirubricoccus phaeus TaxID=2595053 RepID=UPI0011F3F719|nr:GIY-YIG nuclease family protein [Siccirubricoccus phaeus]
MALKPLDVFRELTAREPVALDALPYDHGIYALYDHTGLIRYIGITKNDKYGFHGRIHGRHVGGSEGRSHKFSHAYNTGRMWRAKKDDSADALQAKALRRAFARRYCRAAFLVVPSTLSSDLAALELAVQAIAPAEMLAWGSKRSFAPVPEPTSLVDALLDELRYTPEQHAAIRRQAAKCPGT